MEQDELARAVSLLRSLLYDGSKLAYTGKSFDVLLGHFQNDLTEEPDQLGALIEYWQANLPTLRERLLSIATDSASTVTVNGRDVPLISESVAVQALLGCPPRPKFRTPTPSLPALGRGR